MQEGDHASERRIRPKRKRAVAGSLLLIAASGHQPWWAGRWAEDARWCRTTGYAPDRAVLVLSAKLLDLGESSCRVDSITTRSGAINIDVLCRSHGDDDARATSFTLRGAGDRLTLAERDVVTRILIRCNG